MKGKLLIKKEKDEILWTDRGIRATKGSQEIETKSVKLTRTSSLLEMIIYLFKAFINLSA